MLDYTSSEDYERGYMDKHMDSSMFTGKIDELFQGKTLAGVRVYQSLHRLRDADLPA